MAHHSDHGGNLSLLVRGAAVAAVVLGGSLGGVAAIHEVSSRGRNAVSVAMIGAQPGDTVRVAGGVYRERVTVEPEVLLMAAARHEAVIDAGGRGTAVTLSRGSSIEGFVVRGASVGILSRSSAGAIRHCRVVRNQGTGIMVIGPLPVVRDNVVAYNRGSGIQLQDSRQGEGEGVVDHNTVAYNANHGIALSLSGGVVISNNIIAFNQRYGVRVCDECRGVNLVQNNIYGNYSTPLTLPSGNMSEDPGFVAPKKRRMNFRLAPDSPCRSRGTDRTDPGARFRR